MNKFHHLPILLILFFIGENFATISDDFRTFLQKTYGSRTAELMARTDLGVNGSFGGGALSSNKRPVIFVHGYTGWAGDFMENREYFLNYGYTEDEVYATSYKLVDGTDALMSLDATSKVARKQLKDAIYCKHVKQIRTFIEAVHKYINSQVDVIGCSMGDPLSRKAILGGVCIDTHEDIGRPLTGLVHNYVGVVGPNHGAILCSKFPTISPCNTVTGMACKSEFLNDINSVKGYEASEKVYTVYSDTDEGVGSMSYCEPGIQTTSIPGQTRGTKLSNMSHNEVMFTEKGIKIQFELLQPSQKPIYPTILYNNHPDHS